MLSLEVYKYITSLAQTRPDFISRDDVAHVDPIKTFPGAHFSIHVLAGHTECQQVLTDAAFIQPKIADAIKNIAGDHLEELKPLELFLRNNPIQMDGAVHRATRQAFMREYRDAQRAVESLLYSLADRSLSNFIQNGSTQISKELASHYVDDVIGLILSKRYGAEIDYGAWSGEAAPIFEFFHAPKKLKEKGRQISGLLKALAGNSSATNDNQAPILLSYLLQGRDPLIGALSGYMRRLSEISDEERTASVARIRSRELFWRTSPVNYIGRTATKDVELSGVAISKEDQLILMLPWASHSKESSSRDSLAFGGGSHTCGGQALALSIADAWLAALRSRFRDIDWESEKNESVIPAVFRQYRG